MSIRIEWYDSSETIRVWRFIGNWTWQEFFEQFHASIEVVSQKNYPVAIIMDFTHGAKLPQSLVTNFRNAVGKASPNIEHVVVVGNQYIRLILKTLQTLMPALREKYSYAATYNEALDLLLKQHEL